MPTSKIYLQTDTQTVTATLIRHWVYHEKVVLESCLWRGYTYCKKKLFRIITCNSYFAHSEPLFKQLCLLKICDIYKFQLLTFIFKLTHKQLPQYFEQFTFTFRNQLHNYATRTCRNVLIPNINHVFAKRSIRFIAPLIL